VQAANHSEGQGAGLAHHFVDSGSLADHADQGAVILALLFQAELNGFDRVGEVDGKVLAFVGLCERDQDIQFVAVRGAMGKRPTAPRCGAGLRRGPVQCGLV
jgi:hypothetical protein